MKSGSKDSDEVSQVSDRSLMVDKKKVVREARIRVGCLSLSGWLKPPSSGGYLLVLL